MGTKTGKRASGAAPEKKRRTPKFLLVKDADSEAVAKPAADSAAGEATPAGEGPAMQGDSLFEGGPFADNDDNKPRADRECIRDGLVLHVSKRFGIPHEAAARAVNDMLRLG